MLSEVMSSQQFPVRIVLLLNVTFLYHGSIYHAMIFIAVAQIIAVSQLHGIVMVRMIVEMVVMNPKSIVTLNGTHALEISSHVTMATASLGFTFVMEIMIVWMDLMRTSVINAVSSMVYLAC